MHVMSHLGHSVTVLHVVVINTCSHRYANTPGTYKHTQTHSHCQGTKSNQSSGRFVFFSSESAQFDQAEHLQWTFPGKLKSLLTLQ